MPLECMRRTSGGKGNIGKFIERDPRIHICAAGVPTKKPNESVADNFNQYLLKDEVDALLGDTIIPPPKPRPLLPLRHPIPIDSRYGGPYGQVAQIISPPTRSKFHTICDDLRETYYASYWKKGLGQVPDPTPMLPTGFDIEGTTFGKKLAPDITLYDLVMPKNPTDQTLPSRGPGLQTCRNYCRPAYNPDLTYGERLNAEPRGILMKCALTDDRVKLGIDKRTITNFVKTDVDLAYQTTLGTSSTPLDNINCVPEGYSFGKLKFPENLPECLTTCKIDPQKDVVRKCLAHLNSLRKIMTKKFLPTYFRQFYLALKYYDKEKTGWLPKKIIYDYCGTQNIRFDPSLIQPLLILWNAFDEQSCIEYKTFVQVLNYKAVLPDLPKISEFPPDCLDFRTTYGEMVKLGQEKDYSLRAGLPSGRYLDLDYPITPEGFCGAHRICLCQESDMMSALTPSILTSMFVSHRDMYAKRKPHVVKRVFDAMGEKFTDERFNAIWEEAKKYHSQGWVCYETFRKAMEKYPEADFVKGKVTNNS